MYKQCVSNAHTLYKVAHTSVTNIQIIPFVGTKTIKTVDEVKTILLRICGWPVSMTNIQATSNRLQSEWSEYHMVSMEKAETTTTKPLPTKNSQQNTTKQANKKPKPKYPTKPKSKKHYWILSMFLRSLLLITLLKVIQPILWWVGLF